MEITELVECLRQQRTRLDSGAYYSYQGDIFQQAADTIERQQETLDAIKTSPGAAAALRQITRLMKERDALKAEVERLKVVGCVERALDE
ncbi:MAG: hypothetical protein ACR2RF_33130 [Geminicoccaceae bacterium]